MRRVFAKAIMAAVQWYDARVLLVELLCLREQRDELLRTVNNAIAEVEKGQQPRPGAWITTGVRLRPPRGAEEAERLRELLSQPDDPHDGNREALVLDIAGRGSRSNFDQLGAAVRHALCPEEFHEGPCPIPWATLFVDLNDAPRRERLDYRDLFPPGRRRGRRG